MIAKEGFFIAFCKEGFFTIVCQKDESPPLHPTEKEQSMVMDQKAMTNSPSPLLGNGVEDESAPFHPTEKDK